jgi:hypothetical protein
MKRVLGVVAILFGMFVGAPAAWITVVALCGVVAGVAGLDPSLPIALGGLCGMFAAILVAASSGLVARGLFRSAAADVA